MSTRTIAQRLVAAFILTAAVMLFAVAPTGAQTPTTPQQGEQQELDGWIYGRGAARYSSTTTAGEFSDDGWARGQGMRVEQPSPVDGWAVAQGMRAEQRSTVDGWAVGQGMRSQTVERAEAPAQPTPAPISTELIVTGLAISALLGAATAAVVSRRRHVHSAH